MVAVLHTWGQNLSLHPHLHCVVPGGGMDYTSKWKQVPVSANDKVFLFDVKSLSKVFRGKFMAGIQKIIPLQKDLIRSLYKTDWVVYAKEPFAGPEQVVEYLGRYTHKVAISNHRIIKIGDDGVAFRWRDYRDNREKVMQLPGIEFLRRFCQHILPLRFVRIRHYGLLSTSHREELRRLQSGFGMIVPVVLDKKNWKEICREHLNYDPDLCPHCGKGKMIAIERLLPGRSPPVDPMKINEVYLKIN